MKTPHALTLLASVLSFTACTDAEAPPPRLSGVITPEGCGLTRISFPEDNTKAAALSERATLSVIDALDLVRDGSDDYELSCTFSEVTPGTAHSISIELTRGPLDFRLHAQTTSRQSTTGELAFRHTPTSGNATFMAQGCTVRTFHESEGGGAGLVHYECVGFSTPLQPDRSCPVKGTVYVTDCKR